MLNQKELEDFLYQLLRRSQARGQSSESQLQQLAQAGAQELQAKLMAQSPTRIDGATYPVIKLPPPPRHKEDPDGLFDPQRDITPG